MAASVAFYRPDAAQRLTSIRDFSQDEQLVRDFVQSRVDKDEYLLITGGSYGSTWTYWITHRYPPPPFVNVDVKTIWMLRNRPHEVFDVLDDPRLALVQFETKQLEYPIMEDVFGNLPMDRVAMQNYLKHVQARFEPIVGFAGPATFWRRPFSNLTANTGASRSTQPSSE